MPRPSVEDNYWVFKPKSCAAYIAMTRPAKREVENVTRELKDAPLSTLVAIKGIKTSDSLIEFLGALLADITLGSVEPDHAMACLSVADKIVEVARFSLDHESTTRRLGSKKPLTLSGGDD